MSEQMKAEQTKPRKKKGTGSIYQRKDKSWRGVIQDGKKPDGKPNRVNFYGKTKKEVEDQIKEYNRNREYHREKLLIAASSVSLKESINNWLYTIRINQLKGTSFDRLESTIKTHIIPQLGYLQLANIEAEDVQSVLNKMFKDGASHSGIKKVYDALNRFFDYIIIKGDLKQNPMHGVSMISTRKFPKSEIRFFTKKEARLFENEAIRTYKTGRSVYKNGYVFVLMLNTGIRVGEALGIDKDKDIDLEEKMLRIRGNVATVKIRDEGDPSIIERYETIIQDTAKTDAGDRFIPLTKKAINAIKKLLEISNKNSSLLISNDEGDPLAPAGLNKTFDKILFAAGIDKQISGCEECGNHTLRHYFASRLFRRGRDIKEISEILGHANVSVTYNTYIHLVKEQKVKAIQSLDDDDDDDDFMDSVVV